MPPIDLFASVNSVLSKLQISVEVHRNRLAKVLEATADQYAAANPAAAGKASSSSSNERRQPAVTPATALPPSPDELKELCLYFNISVGPDVAGGHAVLREARRVCEQTKNAPLAAGINGISETAASAEEDFMASPDNLISGQKKYDWTRSVNVRKWHWLTTVTLVSQVESWQTTQSATLENVELTSAPLNAAMLDTMSLDHAVRESGVVAGAAAFASYHTTATVVPVGTSAPSAETAAAAAPAHSTAPDPKPEQE